MPQNPTNHHHQIVYCHIQEIVGWVGVSYPSTDMQSVYSTAPADWANHSLKEILFLSERSISKWSTVTACQ